MIDVFKETKLHLYDYNYAQYTTITTTHNTLPLQLHTIHYHYNYTQYTTITTTHNTLPL